LQCAAKPRAALHRKSLLAVKQLGEAFEASGMPEKARTVYERALEIDSTAEWLNEKLDLAAHTASASEHGDG
jgi:hypothetical protein